jgi:thimet oligopeptidase
MSDVESSELASFGDFPFSLRASELRRRAAAALDVAQRELERLSASEGEPDVEGFLVPLDRVLSDVYDVGAHGSFVFQVHPDAEVRTAGREVSESADQFFNRFRTNDRIYDRLRSLDLGAVDAPTRFAVEKMRREMRRAGVEHDAEGREKLRQLQDRIDRIGNQFNENIAAGEREVSVEPAELAGLPADFVAGHPPAPDGQIHITTRGPDYRPVMAYAERGELRRALYREFMNRAHPANLPVLDDLLAARYELARELGYSTFAAYALEDKMVVTPPDVRSFLDSVASVLREPSEQELARFLARKQRDDPAATQIDLWDIGALGEGYIDGKIRREEFGVDSKRLRDYLPYGRVRDGLFALCGELFDLTFERVAPVGIWHPSVEAFDVRRNGAPIGRMFLDLVPREGKFSHAACFGVRLGTLGRQLPQNALVCNFLDAGTPMETSRMLHGDVVVFFHEFGHLLHALLSGSGRWLYNSMSFIEWDFVEAPSLLFEEWARDPATLGRFARNPETGEAIPPGLLERVAAADGLARASAWLRQVALSATSLEFYDRDPAGMDTTVEYHATFRRYWPLPFRDPYHPQEGWGHLTGYSAFYYTYVWSLVIARDLLRPFLERGTLTDPELARAYAREILEPGSSRPAAQLLSAYLGRPSTIAAFKDWIRDGTKAAAPVAQ